MAFNTHRQNTPETVIPTYNGGKAIERKTEEELALTVLGSYLDGDMYYEKVDDRIKRISALVQKSDDSFVEKLAVVARQEFNLRTPPTVLLAMKTLKSGQPLATTVDKVMVRGDEVTEYLAAVKALSNKGKVIPSAKKTAEKGLQKLTERSALRYSGGSKAWSIADAMRIVHPNPLSAKQSAVFKFLVNKEKEGSLVKAWDTLTVDEKKLLPLIAKAVSGEDTGEVSWERAKSAGQSDWKVLVKDMGYMAMLRNLRNFMQEVPAHEKEFWNFVLNKISDNEEVLRSKQMPYRFYSAFKAVESAGTTSLLSGGGLKNRILKAVSDALNHSAYNLPDMGGKQLVVVDVSGSMSSTYMSNAKRTGSTREAEDISMVEVAAIFGAAAAISQGATLVAFGSTAKAIPVGLDVISTAKAIMSANVGHSTNVHAVTDVVDVTKFDTLAIFTDGQFDSSMYSFRSYNYGYNNNRNGSSGKFDIFEAFKGKIYFADLTGYKPGFALSNRKNVRTLGGFSDATLRLMALDARGGIVDFIKNYKV